MNSLKQILLIFRFHFSFLLSPVFFYGLIFLNEKISHESLWLFFILHLIVYPSSNAFNSYIDQDEGSIGGLEKPPKAGKIIYYLSLIFDLIAIIITFIQIPFALIPIILYIIFSRSYSSKELRLKKYPILSFLVVTLFQGPVIFICVLLIENSFSEILLKPKMLMGILSSFFLIGGNYPITQIYQHKEDQNRGDKTLSIILGIKGSLVFANLLFLVGFIFLVLSIGQFSFILSLIGIPAIFLGIWTKKVFRDINQANFKNTMYCIIISAITLNIIFIFMNILE